jgi:hypothetical protein
MVLQAPNLITHSSQEVSSQAKLFKMTCHRLPEVGFSEATSFLPPGRNFNLRQTMVTKRMEMPALSSATMEQQ